MSGEINPQWILHLKGQFERGRPVLFTGAGFSLAVKNVNGDPIPSYTELKKRIWTLCFPADEFEGSSNLQDLYEHALLRHKRELGELLRSLLTVDPRSVPNWYRPFATLPWQRAYTLNIDDLDTAFNSVFDPPRPIAAISAMAPPTEEGRAGHQPFQFIHLNGTLQDAPDNVTFSVTQYAERAKADLWYIRFTADLVTNPVVFVGSRLEEPPLWQHLILRHGRGGRALGEMRHRSYLVTPSLDKSKQALLAEYNVVWLSMDAETFATLILTDMAPVAAPGLAALSSTAALDHSAGKLRSVAELAVNPGEANEFFMGNEPIWADIQSGRAVCREVDDALAGIATKQFGTNGPRGIILVSGTAGSGKSTSLKRLALSMSGAGEQVGWVDRFTELPPMAIRKAMRGAGSPRVLAMDDADIYGNELPRLLRDLTTSDESPLVVVAIRSGKVDRVLNSAHVEGIPIQEVSMPPLCDSDIPKLIDALERERRLGILTGKARAEQIQAFRDEAGRQLLVAMIKATSGKELKEKAFEELAQLDGMAPVVYGIICLATAFKFGLSRDEILIASRDASNVSLNALTGLISRHIVTVNDAGMVAARHRVIADLVVDELRRRGHICNAVTGLALLAAAKVAEHMHRSARPWRLLKTFINHEFLIESCGLQFAQNLYGELEELLAWDYHFWLQRGSLEVKHGDRRLAEHFLVTARSLGEGDYLVDTEWAYLLFKKAHDEFGIDAREQVEEAKAILNAIIARSNDPYAYHVLGSQGLAWARHRIADKDERARYLRSLLAMLEAGCNKNPREQELRNLFNDVRYEYLNLTVKRPPNGSQGAT